jgi:hypothetical protein
MINLLGKGIFANKNRKITVLQKQKARLQQQGIAAAGISFYFFVFVSPGSVMHKGCLHTFPGSSASRLK